MKVSIPRVKQIEKIVSLLHRRGRAYTMDCCIDCNEPDEIQKALKKIGEMNKELFQMISEFKKRNPRFKKFTDYEVCILLCLFGAYYRHEITMDSSTDLAEVLINDVEHFVPILNSIKSGRLAKFFSIEKGHRNNARIYFEPAMEPDEFFKFMLE